MSQSSKIFCLQHSSLFESYGGVEYYLDDLLSLLSEVYGGNNVLSLIPERTDHFQLKPRPYRIETVNVVKHNWILKKFENRFSLPLLKRASALINEFHPDIILNSHVNIGPLAFALHKLTKVPLVTVVYGIDCWGGLFPQDEYCLKHTDSILSISYWTKKILVDRGYDGSKIQITHPLLDPSFEMPFHPKPVDPASPFRLLTISRLDAEEQYKGHDHVIQAIHQCLLKQPEVKIEYTIQGEGTDKPRLQKLVKDLKLEKFVLFKNAVVDRNELKSSYQNADLFIMPSRFGKWDGKWKGEGFGIVYVEAASMGVPSLAYHCGGATDIIHDGITGLLTKPDNIPELSDKILELARDPEKCRKMGKAAYDNAMKSFTKQAVQKELILSFEKILKRS